MNREQLFESVMKEFQNKAIDVFEEVASKTVVEYLPHVETDTEFNASTLATQYMQDFLSFNRTWRSENFVTSINAEQVRAAIFEEFREELEQGIIADQQREIERLREDLSELYSRLAYQ